MGMEYQKTLNVTDDEEIFPGLEEFLGYLFRICVEEFQHEKNS
jgi:hypothetical protein